MATDWSDTLGRDSLVVHVLRVSVLAAGVVGLAIVAAGVEVESSAAARSANWLAPIWLDARLAAGSALLLSALALVAAAVARTLALTAAVIGLLLVASAVAGANEAPTGLDIVVAMAPLPGACLAVAFLVQFLGTVSDIRVPRSLVPAFRGAAAGTLLLIAATYDPAFDPHCIRGCTRGEPFLDLPAGGHLALTHASDALIVALGVATIAIAIAWLALGRPRTWSGRGVVGGCALVGLSTLLDTLAIATPLSAGVAVSPAARIAAVASWAGSVLLGAGFAWWSWQAIRARIRVARLAAEIGAAVDERAVERALVEALGTADVAVTFPMPDGSDDVRADGSPANAALLSDARTTPVERDGMALASIHHPADAGARRIADQLTPAMLLALDAERLRAVALANLRRLRESRARIGAAHEAERRRLERDLHDGAQQRMLAVAMDLRLASTTAERAGDRDAARALRSAEGVALDALEELRRLARGVHPAILSQGGLGPALSALAEESAVAVTLELDRSARLPELVEAVAYESIADTVAAAVRLGADEVVVTVEREADELVVDVAFEGERLAPSERLRDRVDAAGGTVSVVTSGGRDNRLHAVIPCA